MSDDDLLASVLAGDRRALARAITVVESSHPDHRARAVALLDAAHGHTGHAVRVGVSGPPGVGKSSLIEALGLRLVDEGHRLAVLAVDPSSHRSGGSILGDKTRMSELSRHPEAFIRPSPSRGELGGVARRTGEVLLLCEAAGFDVVVIETVGTGQSEVAVADLVDTFVLLVAAGGGDELQGVKRGAMELADLLVVTKADGDLAAAAGRAVADHRHAVGFLRQRHPGWTPAVLPVSALSGVGVGEVWEAIGAHRAAVDAGEGLEAFRAEQRGRAFDVELRAVALDRLVGDAGGRDGIDAAREAVVDGRVAPWSAADRVLGGLPPALP